MWLMKKWDIYTYTELTSLSQIVLLAKGVWSPFVLLIPLVVIVVGFSNLKKMSECRALRRKEWTENHIVFQ